MRCLTTVAGILLYLARCNNAAVLKCSPESRNSLCAPEERDLSPPPSSPPDEECLPGSEWESNCHSCRCSDSGIAECLKQDSCELQVFKKPIKCKPFTKFWRDCNTCTCLENGLGLCTLVGCAHNDSDRRKRLEPAQDYQKKCVPGTSWKESCNSCWCTDDGISVCTKIGCVGNFTKREAPAQLEQKECKPGTTWKKSCNTCLCGDYGFALCTEIGCLDDINGSRTEKRDTTKLVLKSIHNHVRIKRGVCKPNEEFQVDCNPCKCAANGLSYTCAHSECLEGDDYNKEVEVFMENKAEKTAKSSNNTKKVVCIANRMFIMDCNTCWCNEDGTSFYCTRRICTPESTEENNPEYPELEMKLRVIEKKCRPNEVFELDCNMCRCNADGKSFSCTRRACVDVDDKNTTLIRKTRAAQVEPPKTCQPGTEFRMDCNKCLCNDEGQDFSCTRNDCAAQNGNGGGDSFTSTRSKRESSEIVAMQCVAGSVFDRKCNVCRCTADSLHAVCTIKRCKQETAESETEPTPSFRCTPGDQFKQDCKDCTCSADGKNVFCTIRICDQVPTDIDVGQ